LLPELRRFFDSHEQAIQQGAEGRGGGLDVGGKLPAVNGDEPSLRRASVRGRQAPSLAGIVDTRPGYGAGALASFRASDDAGAASRTERRATIRLQTRKALIGRLSEKIWGNKQNRDKYQDQGIYLLQFPAYRDAHLQ
jgi:hypothetical protein